MKYSDLTVQTILLNFPEFQKEIDEEILFWGGDEIPNHCLFGNCFNENLKNLLNEMENINLIQRIFDFYEYLSTEGDKDIKDLVQVTLLEPLWDYAHIYKRAYSFMGSNTLILNSKISQYLNEPKR